jgi:hypothetical protein
MDKLHGILTAYEMRIGQGIPAKGEMDFKVSKEKKK